MALKPAILQYTKIGEEIQFRIACWSSIILFISIIIILIWYYDKVSQGTGKEEQSIVFAIDESGKLVDSITINVITMAVQNIHAHNIISSEITKDSIKLMSSINFIRNSIFYENNTNYFYGESKSYWSEKISKLDLRTISFIEDARDFSRLSHAVHRDSNPRYMNIVEGSPQLVSEWIELRRFLTDRYADERARMAWILRGALGAAVIFFGISFELFFRPVARRLKQKTDALERRTGIAEELSQTLIGTAVDAIITIDRSGIVQSFNPAAERLFGCESNEIIGKNVNILMPESVRKHHDNYVRSYKASRKSNVVGASRALEGQRKDGSRFPMELSVSATEVSGRELFVGVVRDLTVQRKMEAELERRVELRTAEIQLRDRAIDAAPVGVVITDAQHPDNPIIYANPSFEAITGYERKEILGRNCRFLVEQGRDQPQVAMIRDALAQGTAIEATLRNYRKDGSMFWNECSISPVHDSKGVLTHFVGIQQDITEERRLEQEIGDSERRLRLLTDALPVLITYMDKNLVFRFVNKTAEKWYDKPKSQIIGKHISELLSKEAVELVSHSYNKAATTGAIARSTANVKYRDGKRRHVSRIHAPHFDESGNIQGFFGLLLDVTEQKNTEEKLQQAQKMEAVGQLTGGLSHDFNNLLGIIVGNLDLLKEQLPDDADTGELVEAALEAALRGSDLNRQLLAFSRRQTLQPKIVDVAETLSSMGRLLDRTLGETIEVVIQGEHAVWPTEVDPAQLESAILNLGVNARDAMPDGGTLTIEAKNAHIDEEADDRPAELAEAKPGDYVLVSISDTGTGMEPDVVQRVFEPFFTTKPTGIGTGLGLSMVHGFITQSGGHVAIYSEPGHGTTIRLYLPRCEATQEASESTAADTAMPRGNAETILVVEDNEQLRRVAVKQLKDLGYTIIEADNAKAALARLKQGSAVDLVFSDVVMPGGMDGFDLAREIQAQHPNIATLLTTGFTSRLDDDGNSADKGAMAEQILRKPYRKPELAEAVRNSLAGNKIAA